MEMDAIVPIFSNLAVPVACLVVTFFLWNKEREDHKMEQKELADAIRSSNKELTEAISNNTLVVQKLVDKMEGK